MRIVSWNVNGLRASLKNAGTDLKSFLDRLDADVICLQETKAQRDQLDSSLYLADGYNAYFSFCRTKAGYSGVVTFCRDCSTPVAAEEGLTGSLSNERADAVKCYGEWDDFSAEELTSLDSEGRAVLTEHTVRINKREEEVESSCCQLVVINVYCPMVDVDRGIDLDRLDYKLKFYAALQERCTALERAGKVVVAAGDFNCSKEMIDSAKIQNDPDRLGNSPSIDWMQQFVVTDPSHTSSGSCTELVDSFRFLHPTQEKAYTCWSTLLDSRKINYGTRIDYILVSKSLAVYLEKAEVWQHVEGSDHCPVFAQLAKMDFVPSPAVPSLCSDFFSAGKQRKLSDFLFRKSPTKSSVSDKASPARPPVKRAGASVDALPPPTKSRKLESGKKTSSSDSKQSLISFTKSSAEKGQTQLQSEGQLPLPVQSKGQSTDGSMAGLEDGVIDSSRGTVSASQESSTSTESSQSEASNGSGRKLSQAWMGVFGGPPKPPMCKGHGEPCVLRTVKKQGPNKNKQFWVCARPGGGKGDPEAKCDYFQWRTTKKK